MGAIKKSEGYEIKPSVFSNRSAFMSVHSTHLLHLYHLSFVLKLKNVFSRKELTCKKYIKYNLQFTI